MPFRPPFSCRALVHLNMKREDTNRFLSLSIGLLVLNQLISSGLCAPKLTTSLRTTKANNFDWITTGPYSVDTVDDESSVRLDKQTERPIDSSEHQSKVKNELKINAADLKVLNDQIIDTKHEPKSDLSDDSVDLADDRHDEPDDGEEIIDRQPGPPINLLGTSRDSTSNSSISDKSESPEEDSEIESTTVIPLFGGPNVTLPPLSRMIDLAEQGELDILNKTQPRRIQIDMDTNEEIIGPNDIDKLLIDNDLDNDDFIEAEILSSPGLF